MASIWIAAGHADLLGEPERETERLARLPEELVARDDGGARRRDVLIRTQHVETRADTERTLLRRELTTLERCPEPNSIELRDSFAGHHADDRGRDAERDDALRVLHRETRGLLVLLARLDRVPRLQVDERLGEHEAAVQIVALR